MQEALEEKSVNLVISTTKLTAKSFVSIIQKANAMFQKQAGKVMAKSAEARAVTPKGKQTVKQLIGQNQGVSNIELTDKSIKNFERVARKYGVDFAVKRVKAEDGSQKHLIFFKAKDADALKSAFTEYTTREMKKASRTQPSILEKLNQFKEMMKNIARNPVKHKTAER